MIETRISKTISYNSEKQIRKALQEICIYIFFVIVTTIVALSSRHIYMYYFNNAMDNQFLITGQYGTIERWYEFTQDQFLNNLHNKIRNKTEANELKVLKENILLGPPRLRQIRVIKERCQMHEAFNKYIKNCYQEYFSSTEDKTDMFKSTKFYVLDELDAVSVNGKINTYVGAGYVRHLTYDFELNKAILAKLKTQKWIDRGTRAVVLEFGIYNKNTELFDNIKFIAEALPTGGTMVSTQYNVFKLNSIWTDNDYLVLSAAFIFYIMVIYYTVLEIREILSIGIMMYICESWNYLDITVLMLAYISFVYNIWHPFHLNNMLDHYAKKPNEYHNLDTMSYYNTIYMIMMAICAFLVWIKIFRYISFNKTMMQLSLTFKKCSKDLFGFGLMFGIVFLSYALFGLLLFGTQHPDFTTFPESVLTVMRIVLGDFNYTAIEEANRILGPIYFLIYILLVFFILMNMFLAIINDTFNAVKDEMCHGPSELKLYIKKTFQKIFKAMRKIVSTVVKLCCRRKFTEEMKNNNEKNENYIDEEQQGPSESNSQTYTPQQQRMRLRKSDILREYFELVETAKDAEQLKRFQICIYIRDGSDRIKLMEETLEQIRREMNRALRNRN